MTVSSQALKEAWFDKDMSFILLDARDDKEISGGFIKGAVALQEKDLAAALQSFPKKEMKAPIVIYDEKGDGRAESLAKKLIEAGYTGPRVLTGGFNAWQLAKYDVATGKPAKDVAYQPKPKAGTIPIDEFEGFSKGVPAQIQLVDVRNKEEADESGMINGAINIPAGEIADKLDGLSKDKDIVTYCTTGVRAEMAFNVLKEKGYKVRYLDANIAPDKKGGFSISK